MELGNSLVILRGMCNSHNQEAKYRSIMIEQYYTILEVDRDVTIPNLKKAYRRRAKELHPDINKSENAQEEFIFLNEAFEYIYNLKSGKVYNQLRKDYVRTSTSKKTSYQDWCQTERERTRARARYYAKMRYEIYIRTDYYKITVAIDTLIDAINLIMTILIFLFPILGYFLYGSVGLTGGLLGFAITTPYWAPVLFRDKPNFNIPKILMSIKILLQSRIFKAAILLLLNIYLFVSIGFSTLINTWVLTSLFLISILPGYYINHRVLKRKFNWIVILGPCIINIFLATNYIFSRNEYKESYKLKHKYERNVVVYNKYSHNTLRETEEYQETTAITLEDNKYSEFYGIRIFANLDKVKGSKGITYYFEDGLLGFRVLKDYKFIK